MKTVTLTMAQALLQFLNNQYIEIDGTEHKMFKGVMGIFGHGNVTGLGQALEQYKDEITFIQGKNEQGMAHAAIAYAKQKNRLEMFACTSSIGPGALNMVTAAGVATVNRIPLLLLPGDVFASRQPDPVLQQVEYPLDYTVTANDAFKPVSKYWDRINRPEQLMTAALQAMRVLADPAETGAVTLCLPQDVQCEAYDYPAEFLAKRVHHIDRKPAAASAVARAAELIRGKKRPLIVCGGGVHYSLATEELRQFAEAFRIPVTETQAGKSAISWQHPLSFGGVGVTGTLAANRLAAEADLIIGVGTRMSDFSTASKTAFSREGVEFLNINVSGLDAYKLDGTYVTADAREALQAIAAELKAQGYASAYSPEELSDWKREWDGEVDRLYSIERADGLAQTRVLGEINGFLGERDVIVCAAGSLPGDLHRVWRTTQPKTYHMEYGFSCMGYEVAGAFGIKLAEPDREVYALVGDGSYLMLHSELVTSLQEGRKITIVLFDNHGFQCIHNLQRGHGSGSFGNEFRSRSEETAQLSGDYMPIDFAAHARSLGAKSYSARTVEELRDALEKAKGEQVTTLIDIKVLPGTNTDGYESWWHVGVAEVSEMDGVKRSYEELQAKLSTVPKW
ncbi:3D-(3,5/4)-trihydroxycyclohexane-1,2-dione acylhydrolase (decyclizing) [Paenibacillus doosanensis]|uniref:3D-(3,5/4)-trihydroxycyclohexane-1,2-dione acylhydrolase (decyclizing) n=1 Tax=Paenibacillus doosanensis TaxID=1229154 RepID=UPI00217F8490|nr:3D-(3,5/4)-trihydroxycyclohexane-1,2-dione acylhydrolase (decyclizing) [Paenibacillus doosanensis]MCS7462111.1 3D-(3,5/4)-trihydroxycyclohexane-1,2-dione acylhydrolase (decyclizing) [Paenibacillus doosanensis]